MAWGDAKGTAEERVADNSDDARWRLRAATRLAMVLRVKGTDGYIRVKAATDRPKTPKWHDRSLSKRTWEAQVLQWRIALKQKDEDLEEGRSKAAGSAARNEYRDRINEYQKQVQAVTAKSILKELNSD